MNRITVTLAPPRAHSYPILIDSDLYSYPNQWLPKNLNFNNIVIITDHQVKKLYATRLVQALKKQAYKIHLFSFAAGEKYKNTKTKQSLEEQMFKSYCGRDTLLLALGGGVVGDLTGFLAATYMRGIPYIQLPTTLLAMVDSSIGGKTGIDTPQGKNLIGAFWQPLAVVSNITSLQSLPKKQIVNGLIEALKVFLTHDVKSFYYLEKNLEAILNCDVSILKKIIHKAVKIKVDVVQQDEKEQHIRMVLNLGHTIGHAIEKISQYKILHGYAVGYGILVEAKIAELMGLLSQQDYLIIQNLLKRLDITSTKLNKYNIDTIIKTTQLDKKVKASKVRYVLLKSIGNIYSKQNTFAHPVEDKIVKQAFLAVVGA